VVLPQVWATVYSKSLDVSSPAPYISWPLRLLMTALRSLLHQTSIPIGLCLLVDGLDEFDVDHEELADLFKEITDSGLAHVKACFSSRPWVVFENNFATYPNLRLQNLTHGDIDLYVRDRFHHNDAFRKLAAKEPKSSLSLIQKVVEKAEGVFLWVRIVVDSLLRGVRNLDDMPVLLGRLNLLPGELGPLYEYLTSHIEPVYLVWASKAFQIAQASRDADNHPLASRLSVRGFNPQEGGEKNIGLYSIVEYLHRSARDFLEREKYWSQMLSCTTRSDFNANFSLMKSFALSVELCKADDMSTIPVYAYHAESELRPGKANEQIAILDSLAKLWARRSADYIWRSLTFLDTATLFGLTGYVRAKLATSGRSGSVAATSLLSDLLLYRTGERGYKYPNPRHEMVYLLLGLGVLRAETGDCSYSSAVYYFRFGCREAEKSPHSLTASI
jgi:hypothetical protein